MRLREAPNFCWIQLGANLQPLDAQLKLDEQSNMRIVLARVQIKNCQLYQPVSTAQRRNARQPTRPRVACGSAASGSLTWGPLSTTEAGDTVPYGLQANVDTSAARFQNPPSYTAHVLGSRLFTSTSTELPATFLLDGWVNILSPTAKSFVMQVVMPNIGDLLNPPDFSNLSAADLNTALAGNKWSVVWMGVES